MRSGPMHTWFGLSYASYLVLPRSVIQEMPEKWQMAMVRLLNKVNATYDIGDPKYLVHIRGEGGKFTSDQYADYRYPPKLKKRKVSK